MTFRKKILTILFFSIVSGVMALVLRHVVPLLSGPAVQITSPIQGGTYAESFLMVTGTSRRAADLVINDAEVLLRESGNFSFPMVLIDGVNTITIIVEDKFGRSKTHELTIYKQ